MSADYANVAEAVENASDAQLAEFLKDHPQVNDAAWKSRAGRARRRKDESRTEFIDRVLL